jgi:caffeoyl-CoA O-methyltransferase
MPTYTDALEQYVGDYFGVEDPVLRRVAEQMAARGLPAIAIQPAEGRFLQLLVRASGARKAVEIGTLGGYSGIWLARGLGPGGRLFTLEADEQRAAVAREHFELAGLGSVVEVRLGPAVVTLPGLAAEGPFDFCFIDADKLSYAEYLDWALANVRVGGLIAAHNAFRHGRLLDVEGQSAEDAAMRAFNQRFAHEPRLLASVYPGGDGTLLGVVRA